MVFSDTVKDALQCKLEEMFECEVIVSENVNSIEFECVIQTKFGEFWRQIFDVEKVFEKDIDEDYSLDYLSYLNICQALYDTAYNFDVVDEIRQCLDSDEKITTPGLKKLIEIAEYKQDELACLWGEFTETAAGLFDD